MISTMPRAKAWLPKICVTVEISLVSHGCLDWSLNQAGILPQQKGLDESLSEILLYVRFAEEIAGRSFHPGQYPSDHSYMYLGAILAGGAQQPNYDIPRD